MRVHRKTIIDRRRAPTPPSEMFSSHWQTATAPGNLFSVFRICEQIVEGVARRVAIHAFAPTRCRVQVLLSSSSMLSFEFLLNRANPTVACGRTALRIFEALGALKQCEIDFDIRDRLSIKILAAILASPPITLGPLPPPPVGTRCVSSEQSSCCQDEQTRFATDQSTLRLRDSSSGIDE